MRDCAAAQGTCSQQSTFGMGLLIASAHTRRLLQIPFSFSLLLTLDLLTKINPLSSAFQLVFLQRYMAQLIFEPRSHTFDPSSSCCCWLGNQTVFHPSISSYCGSAIIFNHSACGSGVEQRKIKHHFYLPEQMVCLGCCFAHLCVWEFLQYGDSIHGCIPLSLLNQAGRVTVER